MSTKEIAMSKNLGRILKAFNCKICNKEFIWHWKRYSDFRCEDCRNEVSVEAIEKELEEMSEEEYQSFMDDIEEYNKNNK